jgi:hypothetical protein
MSDGRLNSSNPNEDRLFLKGAFRIPRFSYVPDNCINVLR